MVAGKRTSCNQLLSYLTIAVKFLHPTALNYIQDSDKQLFLPLSFPCHQVDLEG